MIKKSNVKQLTETVLNMDKLQALKTIVYILNIHDLKTKDIKEYCKYEI